MTTMQRLIELASSLGAQAGLSSVDRDDPRLLELKELADEASQPDQVGGRIISTHKIDGVHVFVVAPFSRLLNDQLLVRYDDYLAAASAIDRDDFLAGICVALQCVTAFDNGVLWAEIARTAGVDDLLQYATFVEPDEWQLAGFDKYAHQELNRKKPRKRRMNVPRPYKPSAAALRNAAPEQRAAQAEQQGAGDDHIAILRELLANEFAEQDEGGPQFTTERAALNAAIRALAARQPVGQEPVDFYVCDACGYHYMDNGVTCDCSPEAVQPPLRHIRMVAAPPAQAGKGASNG